MRKAHGQKIPDRGYPLVVVGVSTRALRRRDVRIDGLGCQFSVDTAGNPAGASRFQWTWM